MSRIRRASGQTKKQNQKKETRRVVPIHLFISKEVAEFAASAYRIRFRTQRKASDFILIIIGKSAR